MKVAFCIRSNYSTQMGGDIIQMFKTKEYLEKYHSVQVDIVTNPEVISPRYDLIHVFNFSTYTISEKFIRIALKQKIPVVTSPIYWDYSYASTGKLFNLLNKTKSIGEAEINFYRKLAIFLGYLLPKPVGVSLLFKKHARWMYDNSDFVLPNSAEEAQLLLNWMDRTEMSHKIRVVYNATDISAEKSERKIQKNDFLKKYNLPDGYILQVGRIEYCKNQINLLAALKNNPEIPIVFVGKVFDTDYHKILKKAALERGNVFFIDAVPYEEISSFYRFAKLHVLLSLRESPGLVNIEALANGCPIVISNGRFLPVQTYFPNQPYVVNPLDLAEIKKVVLNAYMERDLQPFDFVKFSWKNVSDQTFSVYTEAVKIKKKQ